MNTPSRTPDGDPLHCAVCGHESRITTNHLSNDTICPSCGSNAWVSSQDGGAFQASEATVRRGVPSKRLFKKHDLVRVTKGNFATCSGEIDRVGADGMFTVIVRIFGRETPVFIDEASLEFLSKSS